jgi:hypothetical protein
VLGIGAGGVGLLAGIGGKMIGMTTALKSSLGVHYSAPSDGLAFPVFVFAKIAQEPFCFFQEGSMIAGEPSMGRLGWIGNQENSGTKVGHELLLVKHSRHSGEGISKKHVNK